MSSQTESAQEQYLAEISSRFRDEDLRKRLLWPTTPINEGIQNQIRAMVGVSDEDVDDPRSRPAMVCSILNRLLAEGALRTEFSFLDVPCGDARILSEVKRTRPSAHCFGLDCHVGQFPSHENAMELGARLYRGLLQDLFTTAPPEPFDVVMMLNTFRSWQNAHLHEGDSNLPKQVEAWFAANARFVILTVNSGQFERLSNLHSVEDWGKGEENSRLVLIRNESKIDLVTRSEGIVP